MKWPLSLTIIRHGQSAYNILREKKKDDHDYRMFLNLFERRPSIDEPMRKLAHQLQERFSTGVSDYETPLTPEGVSQALRTGTRLYEHAPQPDVVFVSPYRRTRATFDQICIGLINTPANSRASVVYDDRIREQEHGLSLLYNDWRIFQTIHPEQRALYKLMGPYWYQYPQGESVSMVRERIRSFMTMLVREYAGKHVWLVSHHLTLLSIRSILERLSPEQFMNLDTNEKPINCGVTVYTGDPSLGSDGKLVLKDYNLKLY